MDKLEFLSYRLAFTGLPYGEVQHVMSLARNGGCWHSACRSVAEKCRNQAETADGMSRSASASEAWRWAACAYHAATFSFHLDAASAGAGALLDLRRLARKMYLRSIEGQDSVREVRIACGEISVPGYWRLPAAAPKGVVVLFNGLDSICEVELHSFGDWLLARGLAVLALDLPATIANEPRTPAFAIERMATPIVDWIGCQRGVANVPIAAFGVSFGGHLVARALSADSRFAAGVAVSPCAWFGSDELSSPRFRTMLSFALGWPASGEMNPLDSDINLEQLPGPRGRLMLYHMDHDLLFGRRHVESFLEWGGAQVEVRNWAAEHVGTSRIHEWLPEACDWLVSQLN